MNNVEKRYIDLLNEKTEKLLKNQLNTVNLIILLCKLI